MTSREALQRTIDIITPLEDITYLHISFVGDRAVTTRYLAVGEPYLDWKYLDKDRWTEQFLQKETHAKVWIYAAATNFNGRTSRSYCPYDFCEIS